MDDPFTPSPELAAITRRWITNYAGRQARAASNLLSRSAALNYIGSDANEVFAGTKLREIFEEFTREHAALDVEDLEVRAFENGNFGWSSSTMTVHAPEAGLSGPFRTSIVFSLEEGMWRIVHAHSSSPKPNIEAMGYEGQALTNLAEAALLDMSIPLASGIASVMFTDVVDSTALAAATGDRLWQGVVTAHLEAVSTEVTRAGGRVVKTLGDGTLSSFTSAAAAMQAAQAIQRMNADRTGEPRLRIRIGIHTGDVMQNDGDLVGTVVNMAARVASAAPANGISVSEATRVMVGGASAFRFVNAAEINLKGLAGVHLIHQLQWSSE